MGTDHELLGDRYRLLSAVRRGRGTVMWHAHDLRLRRNVAIKELRPSQHDDEPDLQTARRRALREARSAARLSHPGVVTVHDLLEANGRLWIVTELLEGLTLEETVRHLGQLPAHWAAWVGFQLLSGVRHAHETGVVHGAIEPANVLLTEDRVVLTDFGMAAIDGAGSTTLPIVRTAAYLAPERVTGAAPTVAADLWSFGATLYCAVEGHPPYGETRSLADLVRALGSEPAPSHRAGPLRPVLEGLLRRDPDDRLTAKEAVSLLVGVLRRLGISAAPPGRRPEVPPARAFTT
ncbi:serine/threonine-protein kinase [Microtetraspora fusca]|uniref:non-specific serine/threonine protein kinase n=1 Tax=Microtetraspora fusca TaxID=1997 RepID=A0ABW6VA89_MICFU|nr:serine/threonine-protein kinase [Microtetraspora fusca]